jgi:hypothetical protein
LFIEELSTWIDAHQLLVVAVLIPLVSAAAAAASSRYSTNRALRTEHKKIKLEGALKIANFRQDWINTLRDSMAEYQSYGILPGSDPTKEREFYRLGTKIELLMNPGDPDYPALQKLMYAFLYSAEGDVTEKYGNNAEYVSICQKILKREWDRLRQDIERNSLSA